MDTAIKKPGGGRASKDNDQAYNSDIVTRAIDAALAIGVELRTEIPFGPSRHPGAGKKPSNTDTAVNRRADTILICDHSTGLSAYAFEDHHNSRSPAEINEAKRKSEYALKLRLAEEEKQHQLAAQEVNNNILRLSTARPDFPYFIRKQIAAFSSLFFEYYRYSKLCVVIPLEFKGEIVNWQSIDEYGNKRPYKGARLAGAYAVIAKPDRYKRILITEGLATACTVSMMEPESMVIAAMFAGNLLSVAQTFSELYSHNEIVICGDDDRETEKRIGTNPGRLKAYEAARSIGGLTAFPEFPPGVDGSDFNDLMCAGCLQ